MYRVTIETEDLNDTYEVLSDSPEAAEGHAIRRFEKEHGVEKDSFVEFKVTVES